MKAALLGLLLLTPATIAAESRFTSAIDKGLPATVRIETVRMSEEGFQTWLGSGVILSEKGHILTCAHVVTDAMIVYVRLYGSTESVHLAVVMRTDKDRDLALIRLVDYSTPTAYSVLASSLPRVGDEVVAIGHPRGENWTVTAGIVSAVHRPDGLAIDLLQTDAAINPGNSGGPLFDLAGNVVGLNESGYVGANNLGFSVSVEQIKEFLKVYEGLETVFKGGQR